MKRLVVVGLELACVLTHRLPERVQVALGACPLAMLSWRLDERWRTGQWS